MILKIKRSYDDTKLCFDFGAITFGSVKLKSPSIQSNANVKSVAEAVRLKAKYWKIDVRYYLV